MFQHLNNLKQIFKKILKVKIMINEKPNIRSKKG